MQYLNNNDGYTKLITLTYTILLLYETCSSYYWIQIGKYISLDNFRREFFEKFGSNAASESAGEEANPDEDMISLENTPIEVSECV